ncbi:MAG: hypothetical protein RLZZ450_2210 [Pseudomonadota bacterium]
MPAVGTITDAWKHWYRRTAVGLAPRTYWRSRYLLRGFEEPEFSLFPQLCAPHSTVVDVGANFGMASYWLTRLAQRCVAFEPIPRLARALQRGFGSSLELHNVALSDSRGDAELIIPRISPGLSTIETKNGLSARALAGAERILVPKRRLDEFHLTNVSFIKIDVEGHEEAVLRGAHALLRRERPSLLIELEERHNPGCIDRVRDLLGAHGLVGAAQQAGRLLMLDDFDATKHQRDVPPTDYLRNFLFARPEVLANLRVG